MIIRSNAAFTHIYSLRKLVQFRAHFRLAWISAHTARHIEATRGHQIAVCARQILWTQRLTYPIVKSSKHRKLPFPWAIEPTDFSPSETGEYAYQEWTNLRWLSGWPDRISDEKGIDFLQEKYKRLWCMREPAESPNSATGDQGQDDATGQKRHTAAEESLQAESIADDSRAHADVITEVDPVASEGAPSVSCNPACHNTGRDSPQIGKDALNDASCATTGDKAPAPVYDHQHLELLEDANEKDQFAHELSTFNGKDVEARRRYIHRYLFAVSKTLDFHTVNIHKAYSQVQHFDGLAEQGRQWVSKRYNSLTVDLNAWHRSCE